MGKMKKTNKVSRPKGPLEWIYIQEERTMREIYDLLLDGTEYDVEYWEEAQVMEVSIPQEGNLDMEASEEAGVYWVTVSPKGYENTMEAMKIITDLCGGHFEIDE